MGVSLSTSRLVCERKILKILSLSFPEFYVSVFSKCAFSSVFILSHVATFRLSFSFGTHPPFPWIGLVVATRCLTWGVFGRHTCPSPFSLRLLATNPSKRERVSRVAYFISSLLTYIGDCEIISFEIFNIFYICTLSRYK